MMKTMMKAINNKFENIILNKFADVRLFYFLRNELIFTLSFSI